MEHDPAAGPASDPAADPAADRGVAPAPAAGSPGGALRLERPPTLADQVADALVEAIGIGLLQPGARIVELDLARRLGVSRVPVREAVKVLTTQGILEGQPSRGTRVAAFDAAEVEAVCEARLALETIALRHLMACADPARRAAAARALDEAIAEIARQVRAGEPIKVNRADIAFHRTLCALSGNRIVATLWEAIGRYIAIIFAREILGLASLGEIVRQHELLRDAVLSDDTARAEAVLRAHILGLRRTQRGAPV